jgi:thiamine-monophosphate kinase
MPTLRELGEAEVVRRLIEARRAITHSATVRDFGAPDFGIVIDAGDDAAIVRPRDRFDLVTTTDALVEGRHYDPAWSDASAIGARLAAVNLSDLAAMAAEPRWALFSIGVRRDQTLDDLLAIQQALAAALARAGAALVGGNVTAIEGHAWWSLTLLGETPRARAWSRHGVRPGDLLAVSGSPGRAAAGLALARALGETARAPRWAPLLDAWRIPVARLDLSRALAPLDAVTAAIDVSDGFGGDLARLCEASGVGARIDERSWPDDPLLADAARDLERPIEEFRYGPSDDYELMLALDPAQAEAAITAAAQAGTTLSVVGRFTDAPLVIECEAAAGARRPLRISGFDHFAGDDPLGKGAPAG